MKKMLVCDEQTAMDLGIFARTGKQSIYSLFNRTVTQGGARLLEELFRSPMADVDRINERASILAFFSRVLEDFPLTSEMVNGLLYYIGNEDVRSQLATGDSSISRRLQDLVATEVDQVFVRDGVGYFLSLMKEMKTFCTSLAGRVGGSAYEAKFRDMEKLMGDAAFREIETMSGQSRRQKMDKPLLAELDKLIRFKSRDRVLELIELLYELDVFMAVGRMAREKGLRFAKALPAEVNKVVMAGVFHPLVEGAIPNDVRLDGEANVLFLTGANMAGKSTLMKSIGLVLYLGHMGFPVPAATAEFSVKDGLISSINLADNLSGGASHYFAEVLRVKDVASALSHGKDLFVIFDELFRGTNVSDAYDATLAITKGFSRWKMSQFVISTHIIEAGEVLRDENAPMRFRFLPTVMVDGVPSYPRVLKEGISADRHGMVIIRKEKIIEMLDRGIKNQEGAYVIHN